MNEASAFAALEIEFRSRRKKENDGGGGGAPTIELSKSGTGLKIIMKSSRGGSTLGRFLSTRADRINAVVISNWVRNDQKAAGRLRGALRYNQERERGEGEDERTFFTDREEGLDRKDIRAEIRSKLGKDIAFHTVILSPGDNSVDIKEFTRETMDEWQEQFGYHIDYYAIEHKNTEHYHAHLIIPASSIDRISDVKFDREDLTNLREIGNDYIARERMIDRAFDRAVAREFGFDRQERNDREFQEEFHMSPGDYRDDQEAAGLNKYEDFIKDQKDLGLGQKYDFEHISWQFEKRTVDDLYGEPETKESEENEHWDEAVTNDFYEEEQADEHVGDELDADTRALNEAMMSDDDDREQDDDDDGGHR